MNRTISYGTINYEKKIFAFIDILGFSYLIEQSKKNAAKIISIYNLLEDAKALVNLPIGHKFKHLDVDLAKYSTHFFSDSITISCPFESFDYFNYVVGWLWNYQELIWTKHRMFLRGAIAYGDVYDHADNPLVFGPAMITAYNLERSARWPRILIDFSVIALLQKEEKQRALKEIIRRDKGGKYYYLDYLHDLFCIASGHSRKMEEGRIVSNSIMLLNNHKVAILESVKRVKNDTMMSQRKRNVLIKRYTRLIKYHNTTIDRFCNESLKLIADPKLVREIDGGVMAYALLEEYDLLAKKHNLKLKYSADNLEYIDIMPILAIIDDIIYNTYPNIDEIGDNDPQKLINFLCMETPKFLSKFLDELRSAKINDDILALS
jgi:hypothetical protein